MDMLTTLRIKSIVIPKFFKINILYIVYFFNTRKHGKEFIYFEESDSLSESIVLQLLSYIKDIKQTNLFLHGWYSSKNLWKNFQN